MSEILPVKEVAKRLNRNRHVLLRAWQRAGLPTFPVEIVQRNGKKRTVKGLDWAMVEAYLLAGGWPRRRRSKEFAQPVVRRFGL